MKEIQIANASPEDADVAAILAFAAYHKFSYDIFGEINEEAARDYFKKLWLHGENRFGHCYSYVAKTQNKTIGLITCYPTPLIRKLVYPTVWQLINIGRFKFIWHFLTHLENFYYFSSTQDLKPNEMYIATLSVLPEYRCLGVGTKMLQYACNLSKEMGLKYCTLHVDAKNNGGIRFYERNGFTKAPPIENVNYFRMVHSV